LTVVQGTSFGKPANKQAIRTSVAPKAPLGSTVPITTSPINLGSILVVSIKFF